MSKGTQEGATHAVAIGKARLPGDDVDRMAALLHHQAGGLDAKVLDRLGRRVTGLGAERTAELTRAQMRRVRKLLNRQLRVEIALRIGQCVLDTVGFGLQLQQGRELRLAAGAAMVQHKPARNSARRFEAEILFDQSMKWVMATLAGKKPDIDRVGLSYMLMGEARQGQGAPKAKDPRQVKEWFYIGPHVMLVPRAGYESQNCEPRTFLGERVSAAPNACVTRAEA